MPLTPGVNGSVSGDPEFYAKYYSDYWSKELNSKVTYSNPEEIIFLMRKEFVGYDEFWFVIIGEKVGWIGMGNVAITSLRQE